MAIIPVDIEPGGMLTDLVENKLGKHQHQEVINLRQDKIGEWECVLGYRHYFYDGDGDTNPDFTDIKADVEISDDESGDRFLLVQEGQTLRRINYNISNSPIYGYENESNSTITLPSGVTIAADAKLRFFYFRGIVRITGASEPLWYGYIKRTLFPNSWSTENLDDFNSGVDGWTGSDANISQETVSPLLESAGTLEVTATAYMGYAYKAFTVEIGKRYTFFIKGMKETGQTINSYALRIGTTQGGNEYTGVGINEYDVWNVLEREFTATTTTVYVALTPTASGDYTHFDYALLRENHQIEIEDWYLFKAQLLKPTDTEIANIDVRAHGVNINSGGFLHCLGGVGFGYDLSQYSMLREDQVYGDHGGLTIRTDNLNAIGSGAYGVIEFDVAIDGTMDSYRLTSILVAMYYKLGEGGVFDPEWDEYNVYEEIDFTEEYEKGWIFSKQNFHNLSTNHKRLNLWQTGDIDQRWWDGLFQVGRRIKIVSSVGTIDTIITSYNEATNNDQNHYIEVLDDTDELGVYDSDLDECGVWIEKMWDYSGGNYSMRIAREIEGANQGYYNSVSDIPAGTEDINPNFTHWTVIEEIAYINSLEDEESDAVRYSPIYQFDSFPDINIQQVLVGDIDNTRALIKRLNRLVILKRHSLTQGNFVNGQYYEDISPRNFGLYALDGYKIVGSILYFMEKDDFYLFAGSDPQALLVNQQMRSIYREYISEDSLIEYDSLNNELILILKGGTGKILVFHPERKEWYIRETDVTIITSFIDYDKRVVYGAANKLFTFNHSYTTFDESIRWYIKTKLFDDQTAEYDKKINKVRVRMSGSKTVTVNLVDPEENRSKTITFFPDSDQIQNNRAKPNPNFLFKQVEIEFEVEASLTQAASIRHIQVEIEKWK